MKRILFIHSSLFGDDSAGTQIARSLVERLVAAHPGSTVSKIDLAQDALPHLDAEEFNSWSMPAEQRNEAQQALAARSDVLIEQLLAHDTLVLAVPMYNLGIPSTLKAWIDRVVRAGKTFTYTSDGPQGLAGGMQAYLVLTRGGSYRNTPLDTQTAYLESVLGLIGIDSVQTVYAESLNRSGDARENSVNGAMARVMELTASESKEYQHAAA
ncbi:MAG: FMN-dependent NADH-azoreductase [Lysobacterales bacterium]|jgi:FMN-dependent NADH-azoreductase